MSQKILVESLSMDLLRVALGLHRGSLSMAERFRDEAALRQSELEAQQLPPYLKRLIAGSKPLISSCGPESAEDILMYSILFQNFARTHYN